MDSTVLSPLGGSGSASRPRSEFWALWRLQQPEGRFGKDIDSTGISGDKNCLLEL